MVLKLGTSARDSLVGTDAADSLYGGGGADTLVGMAGADLLDGGAGADRMLGGFGADTYLVNDPGDLVVESDDGSVDHVISSVSYALPAFVDNLTLTGTANLTGTGNALNNVIVGNAGANLLTGGAGNDRLNGGAGADTLRGGTGNDTYVVSDTTDLVVELQAEGVDLVLSSISLTLAANVENLTLSGTADLVGVGNALNNTLTGNAGGNVLLGGAGNDILRGEGGNDILRGDAGADQLYGGAGTDVFVLSALQDSRPGTQRDVIQDFNAAEDVLHLIDIAPGSQITYLGTSSFVAGSGSVLTRLAIQGADAVLQIDAPGTTGRTDGVADAEILLKGVQSLQLWNIIDAVAATAVVTPPTPQEPTAPPPSPAEPPSAEAPTTARTVYIDTSASRSGDGSIGSPLNTWGGGTLQADTSYLFKAGTVFNGVVVVRGQGTEDAPIVVGSYGSGAPPVIQGTISVENAAHVTIADLAIRNSEYAGVAVQGGSRDISILNNTIQNTGTGVWFDSATGGGNLVQGNLIEGNRVNGVAFNRLDHSADPTRVVGNVIRDNGSHGIEIHANGISVEANTVSGNGRTIPGSTGIHIYGGLQPVYGGEGADGFGIGNVVRGNRVFDNREASSAAFDGNGIQADTYTGNNRIEQNIVYGNDGAGIIAYDSSSNVITGNTISGNGLNRAGNPNRPLGEIILNTDISKQPLTDLTRGNVVQNNRVTTTDADVAAFYVDGPTADNGNVFGGNTVERLAGGNVYVVGGPYGTVGSNLSLWNSSLAPGGGDDVWAA